MHSRDPKVLVGGEPGAMDPVAWRDHVRRRHAVADLLRQVHHFWRRAGLDELQPTSNLLTRLVDTCPLPPDREHRGPNIVNPLLADVLDEGIRQLEEARWLIDLQEAIRRLPHGARDAALEAVRDGQAQRQGQRAGVIDGLRSKADRLWQRDLQSALDRHAIETVRHVSRQLLRSLLGGAGPAAEREDLRKWCSEQVSRSMAAAFAEAVVSARGLAVGLVEDCRRRCREQVADPNDELRRLFADDGLLSKAPDQWQLLGDAPTPEFDDLSVPVIGPPPTRHRWTFLSVVARLPSVIGRCAFIAVLRHEMRGGAASVAAELADRLRRELLACIQRLDLVSAAAVDRSLRRVETLLGRGAGADSPTPSAAEMGWSSLVGRLREARAALLEGVPIPESAVRQRDTLDDRDASGDGQPNASKSPLTDPSACPVCAEAGDAVFRFMCHFHGATAADGDGRRAFLLAGGLCPAHTWYLEPLSAPRGLSVTYPPLLDSVAERLRAFSAGTLPLPATDESACAACRARRAAEEQVVGALVESLASANSATDAALQACQFHLSMIVVRLPPERREDVLAATADRLTRLADDMREYALKLDALRGSRLTGEESQAYIRALAFLAGERKVL